MLEYQSTIGVKDTSGPSVVGTPSVSNATPSMVITFNEVMDLATLANPSNYLIGWSADGSAGATTTSQLPNGTEITPVQSGKAVILTFPEFLGTTKITFADASATPAVAGTLKSIQVMGVKDVAGNVLSGYTTGALSVAVTPARLAPYGGTVTTPAVFTAKNTVKVKFDQAIGTAKATDFVSSNPAVTVQSAVADGSNVIILTLAGNTSTSNTAFTLSTAVDNTLAKVNGNKVVAGATIAVTDQVKPEVKLGDGQVYLLNSGNTILLPFSENLTTANQALMATDLVVTDLSTNKPVTLDRITTTVTGNVLNIAVTPVACVSSEYSVKVKSGATYIKDLALDTAVESATYETARGVSDGVAPTLSSVAKLDLNGNGDIDTLKVTFSEPVDDSTLDLTTFTGYTVNGSDTVTGDVVDNNVVYLTLNVPISGTATSTTKLTLTAGAVKDIAGNANIADATGVSVVDAANAVVTTTVTAQLAIGSTTATTATVVFSAAISAASKTAFEEAITAEATTGTLAYSWTGSTLTITNTGAATTFTSDVSVNVVDLVGNESTVKIIDLP